MAHLDINGITIGYDDKGSGPCLLLVHGHPFNRSMWSPQAEYFSARGWRVVAPDLRGYGESTVVPGLTPLEVFAGDCLLLLDELGVDRFVLAGLSMGGQIAMEIYRQAAKRIAGLILADTFPQAEKPAGKLYRYAVADVITESGIEAYAKELLPNMIAHYNVRAMPDVAEHVLNMMATTPPEGAAAALRGRANRRDYVDTLGGVSVPTLIVVGRDDAFTPIKDAEFMHQAVTDSTLIIVEGTGHLPNLERPEVVNSAWEAFLKKLTA